MNIENYSFSSKPIGPFAYLVTIRDNINQISYCTNLQSQGIPDNQSLFEIFKNKDNFKHFWIELDIIKNFEPVENSLKGC